MQETIPEMMPNTFWGNIDGTTYLACRLWSIARKVDEVDGLPEEVIDEIQHLHDGIQRLREQFYADGKSCDRISTLIQLHSALVKFRSTLTLEVAMWVGQDDKARYARAELFGRYLKPHCRLRFF